MTKNIIQNFINALKPVQHKTTEHFTARQVQAAIMLFILQQHGEEENYSRMLECKKIAPSIKDTMTDQDIRDMLIKTPLLTKEEGSTADTIIATAEAYSRESLMQGRTYASLFLQYSGKNGAYLNPKPADYE